MDESFKVDDVIERSLKTQLKRVVLAERADLGVKKSYSQESRWRG